MSTPMKFTYHSKLAFPTTALLLCLLGFSGPTRAEAPQSASCPGGMAHHHSGHGSGGMETQHGAIAKQAETECSNCHGLNGIGINDKIPNLAGQESSYMCGWLAGCRIQGDKCEGHEDIAGKLSDRDIIDFAEFYAHLPTTW